MKLSCLIVDDEPMARNLLKEYVRKIPFLELVDTCPNPIAAIEVLNRQSVDLLLLDIQMPEITGINFLKILKNPPMVILTTAYSEYALDGYEFDVVDYLLKPITFERFLKAIEKASQRVQAKIHSLPQGLENTAVNSSSKSYIFVKDGTKLVKVKLKDILYVEGMKDYVAIHTKTQKVVSLQRLKQLEAELPQQQFVRIHNSYIVALDAIDTVHKTEVQIGDTMLSISDSYKKTFRQIIGKNQVG